jgi:hypothetical protein
MRVGIREEAAMAAITFNAAHRKERVRKQFKAVRAAFCATLDAFVSNRMRQAAAQAEHAATLPAGRPATVTAEFRPLDAGVVSEAIPAFFIGRNKEGFWVARDASGQIGGIFLLENSALSFARKISRSQGCATIFPSERFELDLENNGNPLIAPLGRLRRVAVRHRHRMIAFIGKIMKTVRFS